MNENIKKIIGDNIGGYHVSEYINSGSFGHVFKGKNEKGEIVAIKIPVKTSEKDGSDSIKKEISIYKKISNPENGIINVKYEKYKDSRVIIMDLLGESLEKILVKNKKFSLKSIIYLSIQMITIMKHLHSCGYIHRDLKPDNFVTGVNDKKKIYCIDFGLSRGYIKNGAHVEMESGKSFIGTARYAPISSHIGNSQSRKDDLESIAYILIYLYKGVLPWMNIKNKEKQTRYRLIGEKKMEITEEELTKGMPREFTVFLKYVKRMDYTEIPPYNSFYKMFYKLYKSKDYKNEEFDYAK